MRRRDFLKIAGTGAAGAAFLAGRTRARADGGAWGDYPDAARAALLPAAKQAKSVLEVFLHGGMCPWDTFYAVDRDDYGRAAGQMWWTFQDGVDSISSWWATCGGTGAMLQDFRTDELGALVKLGPFADPLRGRKDIVSRLRLHVMEHDLFPHVPAVTLAATGSRQGAPRLAGIGSAVQHHALTHATGVATYPYAYVVNGAPHASVAGLHPAASAPLTLRTEDDALGDKPRALIVANSGAVAPEVAALAALYDDAHGRRLTWPGSTHRVRSATAAIYESSNQQLAWLQKLAGVLPTSFSPPAGQVCGMAYEHDRTRFVLQLAARLLRHPGSVARHVLVGDTSFAENVPMPDNYDFHSDYVRKAAAKLPYLWQRLVEIINEPGENDPAKIDLDETMVVVNTEFGRSPGIQGTNGRNHWPTAYVTLMFGGPIGPDQQGIVGAIDANARPVHALKPAETRAATLAALGIYPFSAETFSFADVAGVTEETEAALKIKEVVLGVTS